MIRIAKSNSRSSGRSLRLIMAFGGAVLLLGLCYWAYLGARVVRAVMADYVPTPYSATEDGRALLARGLNVTERIGWTLADGARQSAFYLPSQNGAVILYAHGSPGTALSMLPEAQALSRAGYGAILIDLPGYGESEGRRVWGDQFLESIRLAVDFAQSRPGINPARIGGHGYSSGGSLMARAAAADPRVSALVLVASYTNNADQLRHGFRHRVPGLANLAVAATYWAGVPVSSLDTVEALGKMGDRRTLIISGGRDHTIPLEMAERLRASSVRTEKIIFEQMDHVGFTEKVGEPYLGALKNFWDDALTGNPGS